MTAALPRCDRPCRHPNHELQAVCGNRLAVRVVLSVLMAGVAAGWWAGPVTASPYSDAVLADNPLAYWRLGEATTSGPAANLGTGGAAYDLAYRSSPSPLPATGAAGLLTADPDTAVSFSNTPGSAAANQQYLSANLATATGLNLTTQSFSLEVWARTSVDVGGSTLMAFMSTGGGSATVVDGTSSVSGGSGYTFHINGGNIRLAAHGTSNYQSTAAFPDDGLTHHLVVTFDNQANNTVRFYLDGTLVSTLNGAGDPIDASSGNPTGSELFALGAFAKQTGVGQGFGYWNGTLDEAAVYGYVLSDAQVAAHFAAGTNPVPEPATLAGAGLAALAVLAVRRRHRHHRNPA